MSDAIRGIRRHEAGSNHWYSIDGIRAEGVTTLIGDGQPKPAIPYWAARPVAEYVADLPEHALFALRDLGHDPMVNLLKSVPWQKRDTAGVRGSEIHKLAEELVRGNEVEVPEHLAGYVDSAVAFMDEWQPAPVLIEAVVASRQWSYAGTLDLVADLPDGRRALMDYKTAARGIFAETAMQLAAYRWAETYIGTDGTEVPMREVGIDCAYGIWIRADGYQMIPVKTDEAVFRAFLHVAQVARNKAAMKSWMGPPEEAPARILPAVADLP